MHSWRPPAATTTLLTGQTIPETPVSTLTISPNQQVSTAPSGPAQPVNPTHNARSEKEILDSGSIICHASPVRLRDRSILSGDSQRSEGQFGPILDKKRYFVVLFSNPFRGTLEVFPIYSHNDRGIAHSLSEVREQYMGIISEGDTYQGDAPEPALEVIRRRTPNFAPRKNAYVSLDRVTIEQDSSTVLCGTLTDDSHELLVKRAMQLDREKWNVLRRVEVDES
ncbi:uncharacterized protein BDZ99DRAFT_527420 [Mytilinidion resinicola]|uniref:Uncharacterized protein n=1 Tax=Mytilinidion resinicola TaxID=574789 RepID=A0A6A6Y2Z5_9PEZI|nr:uncharacterized protein BDZ99DRAFT_527420 [Mytilinidion resinicola]KAF2802384.1 hypothetical protein BDZ99DRAFT_527420 [Mytilinidion resinicola]